MSFFDDLTQKAKVVAVTATGKAKEAAASAKLSADILAEKRDMDKNYRAIGQWFVCEYTQEVPEAIADVVAAVGATQQGIALLLVVGEMGGVVAVGERVGAVGRVCVNISDSKFCPHCGAPMGERSAL